MPVPALLAAKSRIEPVFLRTLPEQSTWHLAWPFAGSTANPKPSISKALVLGLAHRAIRASAQPRKNELIQSSQILVQNSLKHHIPNIQVGLSLKNVEVVVCVPESSSGSGISRFARGKPGKPSMNGALKVIRSWNTECVSCTCLSTTSCICQATLLRCFCATHEHNFKNVDGYWMKSMPGRGITCNYRYIHPHPPIRQLLFCLKKKTFESCQTCPWTRTRWPSPVKASSEAPNALFSVM